MGSLRARRHSGRSRVAVFLAATLAFAPIAPLAAQTPAQKPAAPAAAAPSAAQDGGGGWPRGFTTATGADLVMYQPQIQSWPNQKHLTAYSAVSYMKKGETKPAMGTIKLEADTSVAAEDRLVSLSRVAIVESNFPGLE